MPAARLTIMSRMRAESTPQIPPPPARRIALSLLIGAALFAALAPLGAFIAGGRQGRDLTLADCYCPAWLAAFAVWSVILAVLLRRVGGTRLRRTMLSATMATVAWHFAWGMALGWGYPIIEVFLRTFLLAWIALYGPLPLVFLASVFVAWFATHPSDTPGAAKDRYGNWTYDLDEVEPRRVN